MEKFIIYTFFKNHILEEEPIRFSYTLDVRYEGKEEIMYRVRNFMCMCQGSWGGEGAREVNRDFHCEQIKFGILMRPPQIEQPSWWSHIGHG